ncbi:hypothetical protein E2C01_058808 [Portunus trituberculatus]|uniref:Uncharacterized protein n=1 Tax=Portunus trituberculatus TaxID=210409 RepID=A0A5B7H6H2_PORTR|nr:hypothetical protein [Portunus trituberculatus]
MDCWKGSFLPSRKMAGGWVSSHHLGMVWDLSFLRGKGNLPGPVPGCNVLQDNVHPVHRVLAVVPVVEQSHLLLCGDVQVVQLCSGKDWNPGWSPGWIWNTHFIGEVGREQLYLVPSSLHYLTARCGDEGNGAVSDQSLLLLLASTLT